MTILQTGAFAIFTKITHIRSKKDQTIIYFEEHRLNVKSKDNYLSGTEDEEDLRYNAGE